MARQEWCAHGGGAHGCALATSALQRGPPHLSSFLFPNKKRLMSAHAPPGLLPLVPASPLPPLLLPPLLLLLALLLHLATTWHALCGVGGGASRRGGGWHVRAAAPCWQQGCAVPALSKQEEAMPTVLTQWQWSRNWLQAQEECKQGKSVLPCVLPSSFALLSPALLVLDCTPRCSLQAGDDVCLHGGREQMQHQNNARALNWGQHWAS